MERKIIILLTLILIGIGVTNCEKTIKPTIDTTSKETPKEKPIVSTVTEEDVPVPTVSKMGGIAHALGCMFAPDTCQAKKDLGETEENKQ